MHKWILNCLAFKKTIFAIALILLIISALGIRFLTFDYKMSVSNIKPSSTQTVLVAIYDKHLLDATHLQQLDHMQKELAAIKSVKKILSLYTVPNFRRYLDENTWHSILDQDSPSTSEELRSDVLDNQLIVGRFSSKAADTTLFYLTIPNDKLGKKGFEVREEIQQVLDRYKKDFSKTFQLGGTEMSYVLIKKARHDFLVCIPSVFVFMAILFGWLFRNVFLFSLPTFSSIFGVICALGAMGWLGIPVSPLFIAAIVLTLAIGVAESAHIIHAYQKSMRLHPEGTLRDHHAFILKAVLFPFLLAVSTALLGFLLDILSFVPVIVDAAYALALCMVFNTSASIFISPLLLPFLKVKISQDRKLFSYLSNYLVMLNHKLLTYWKFCVAALLCITIAGVASFYSIAIETLPYALVKKNDPIMQNTYFVDNKIAGMNSIKVNIFSQNKNIFLDPVYLQKILDCEKLLLKIPHTSYTYSVADVIASTNQIFLFNTKKFFKIPEQEGILASYYQALEEKHMLDGIINAEYDQLTVYINYAMYSSSQLGQYKDSIQQVLNRELKNTPLQFKVIDRQLDGVRVVTNLLILQIISIFSIYLICFFSVGIMFRSIKAGLISVIPNIFPLCMISIVQYLFDIPISTFSVILYSIVVGLSMDETIHIFYAYREQYKLLRDKHKAIEAALRSQVTPVTIASVAIAVSWLVLLFSQFLPVFQLGFLCGIGISSAWFADLVITPFFLKKVSIIKN